MNVFENFWCLKTDMENKGWMIEAFNFNYKEVEYVILAKLYQKDEVKHEYSLLKTEIIKINSTDANKSITIPVNSNGFIIDPKTLRKFFNIEYSNNTGEVLQQFNQNFSKFIPTELSPNKTEELKNHMVVSLSKSDSEDPNKKFCFAIKRNPENKKRTPFNDNKTRLLRNNLYLQFQTDSSISFCYSTNKEDEKSDEEILSNFTKR